MAYDSCCHIQAPERCGTNRGIYCKYHGWTDEEAPSDCKTMCACMGGELEGECYRDHVYVDWHSIVALVEVGALVALAVIHMGSLCAYNGFLKANGTQGVPSALPVAPACSQRVWNHQVVVGQVVGQSVAVQGDT